MKRREAKSRGEKAPACWEPGFQAWAQSTCPELSAQGLVPLRCLGGEDPLEKEMATHSSILAWRIPWTGESPLLSRSGGEKGLRGSGAGTPFKWMLLEGKHTPKLLYLSFSPLLLASLLFTAICKASPDSHFAFLHFFFLGMVLMYSVTNLCP